jgi:hypothetical protein
MSQSRFAFLKDTQAQEPAEPVTPPTPEPSPAAPVVSRGPGRPPGGKRSNPDYEQVSHYIRADTHKEVKKLLLDEKPRPDKSRRDMSDLIEELLSEWVSNRKSG